MKQKYELIASDPEIKIQGNVFSKGRILLGRSESCDVNIEHDALSSVHAVLEILDDSAILYEFYYMFIMLILRMHLKQEAHY